MKLENLPTLRTEDFPDQASWIEKLFTQLNPYFQSLFDLCNQNIDYSNNFKSVTRSYTIDAFQAFDLSWPHSGAQPVDVRVTKALKGTDATCLVLCWYYDASTKLIKITRMSEVTQSGVSALSGTYTFTIRATI